MRSWRVIAAGAGFTLVEAMVCCLIVALLLGLAYAAAEPARERARETTCLSNLRQIGMAIRMYQQDYGRGEPSSALTADQLGLPPAPTSLMPYLSGGRGVFLCADEVDPPGSSGAHDQFGTRFSYMWCMAAHEGMYNGFPSFRRQVERRGSDTPMVVDIFHQGDAYGEHSPRPWLRRYVILRLDGRVEESINDNEARPASWQW